MLLFRINYGKVSVFSTLFSEAGYEFFINFDKAEPEYRLFNKVYDTWRDTRFPLVLGIGVALIDYQLPAGGAERFWREFEEIITDFTGFDKKLKPSLQLAKRILRVFVSHGDTCKRLRRQKIAVIERYLKNYADQLWNRDYVYIRDKPENIWFELSRATNRSLDSKTIVFSMKILDLLSLIIFGEYSRFKRIEYLPLDFHVARLTLLSGIIEPIVQMAWPLNEMVQVLTSQDRYRVLVFKAWSRVAENITEAIGKQVSPLRIDSILWQLDKQIYRNDLTWLQSVTKLRNYIVKITNIKQDLAERIAREFLTNYRFLE